MIDDTTKQRIAEVLELEASKILDSTLKRLTTKSISPQARLNYQKAAEAQACAELALMGTDTALVIEFNEIAKSYMRAAAHHVDINRLDEDSEQHEQERKQFIASGLEIVKALAPLIVAAI